MKLLVKSLLYRYNENMRDLPCAVGVGQLSLSQLFKIGRLLWSWIENSAAKLLEEVMSIAHLASVRFKSYC